MSKYLESLKNPKWQKKRLKILEKANFECTSCGDKEKTLHVHHSYYLKGKKAWEYPDNSLHALCEDCHSEVEKLKHRFNELLGLVSPYFTSNITGYILGEIAYDKPESLFLISSSEEIGGLSDYWGIEEKFVMEEIVKNNGSISGRILSALVKKYGSKKSYLKR